MLAHGCAAWRRLSRRWSGGHAALIERKGLYYAMWRQQIGERPGADTVAVEPDLNPS